MIGTDFDSPPTSTRRDYAHRKLSWIGQPSPRPHKQGRLTSTTHRNPLYVPAPLYQPDLRPTSNTPVKGTKGNVIQSEHWFLMPWLNRLSLFMLCPPPSWFSVDCLEKSCTFFVLDGFCESGLLGVQGLQGLQLSELSFYVSFCKFCEEFQRLDDVQEFDKGIRMHTIMTPHMLILYMAWPYYPSCAQ